MTIVTLLHIVAYCLVYLLLSKLLKVSILDIFIASRIKAEQTISGISVTFKNHNERSFRVQTVKEKNSSILFYILMKTKQLLVNLGWTGYATPELLIIAVILLAATISTLASVFIHSIILRFCLCIVLIVWIFTLLYVASQSNAMRRQKAFMQAEDIICQNLEKTFKLTVENNIKSFDELVKPTFIAYINNYQIYKSNNIALDLLNMEFGRQATDLCDKAKLLETKGGEGIRDTFKNNILRNESVRKQLNIEQDSYNEQMRGFALACGLAVGFIIILLSFEAMRIFFKTTYGQALIVSIVAYTAKMCFRIQQIHSKTY